MRNLLYKLLKSSLLITAGCFGCLQMTICQPGVSIQLDKPEKYRYRILKSEKYSEKKLDPLTRSLQNLTTHYNYFFHANEKMNQVLEVAQTAHKDDFNVLLAFYPYELEQTASQKNDLDSIISKCNDAIVLHDIRNDWVDDLYLLMGKAYYFQKNTDSATICFQYINQSFQPRNKDEIGYVKYIGSNINESGSVFNIASKEKKNPLTKLAGHTPARNEALIWLVRSFIEAEAFGDAAGLLNMLRMDVNFPKRLRPALHEVQSYLFYKQGLYDSSAFHLEKCLNRAANTNEKARWEYLIAQLWAMSGKYEKAVSWYEKAILDATDPILETYARINSIRWVEGKSDDLINKRIGELLKMVGKYKYENYRHLIYYAIAQMEIARNAFQTASSYLQISAENAKEYPEFRMKALLELGNMAFLAGRYDLAAMGYDSISTTDPAFIGDALVVNERKNIVSTIQQYRETIRVEDSLLRIAALPETDRQKLLQDILKKLRKEKGIREESGSSVTGTADMQRIDPFGKDQPVDIFSGNAAGKGEWYFYNTSMRSRGVREFKVIWGDRPNVDNWRRSSQLTQLNSIALTSITTAEKEKITAVGNRKSMPAEISLQGLMDNVPLSPDRESASRDTIEKSFFELAKLFRTQTEDCASLISNNEQMLNRFPKSKYAEEALFGLYQCYMKIGDSNKAKKYKDYLSDFFAQSPFHQIINKLNNKVEDTSNFHGAVSKRYEEVLSAYRDEKFDDALRLKQKVDSLYGENFWTPQLLYVEAVCHVRQRADEKALALLTKIGSLYPTHPMSDKAAQLIDVLKNRNTLEDYLTNLQITRSEPDEATNIKSTYIIYPKEPCNVLILREQKDSGNDDRIKKNLIKFHLEQFPDKAYTIYSETYDSSHRIFQVASFSDIFSAHQYLKGLIKKSAAIFEALPKDSLKFLVISPENQKRVMKNKDWQRYFEEMDRQFPLK